jgi:hypothetical protein
VVSRKEIEPLLEALPVKQAGGSSSGAAP